MKDKTGTIDDVVLGCVELQKQLTDDYDDKIQRMLIRIQEEGRQYFKVLHDFICYPEVSSD